MTRLLSCRPGRRCLLMLGLSLAPLPAAAYSDLIVFGDSLGDSGQFPDIERLVLGEPGSLRFTNREGPTYLPPAPYGEVSTQRLARALDLGPLLPSTSILREQLGLPDGNNYATGGYTTADILASITQPDGSVVEVPNLSPAVEALLASLGIETSRTRDGYLVSVGTADPEALYYLNGGGNDFLQGLVVDPAGASLAANTLADGAAALIGAGATTLVVSNVPDVGATPAGLQSDQRQAFAALGEVYNRTLGERLAGYDGEVDIIRLNIDALFDEVVAEPADFGLATDVALTDVCFSDPSCESPIHGLTSADPDPGKLLFNDSVHPTAAGQEIVADYAYALIEAPQTLALAGELTLGALNAQQRAIGNELRPGLQRDGVRVFAQGDYLFDQADAFADGSPESSQGGAGVGFVVPAGAGWLGAAISQREADLDEPAEFDLEGQAFSVFARQHLGRVGAQAIVSGGDFDLDLRRRVTLGQAERTLKGDADSGGWSAELRLDYRLTAEDSAWYTAPFVAYRHTEAEVDGYRERGSKANALVVEDQDLEDRRLELGMLLDRGLVEDGIGFYGEAAWGRYLEDEREGAEVRLASLPTNSWSGEAREREDDHYLRAEAGLRVRLGDARFSIGGGAQGWDEWAPHVHVGAGFTF